MEISTFEQFWGGTASNPDEARKFWDLRSEEFNENIYRSEGVKRLEKLLSLLEARNMFDENSEILDIGCGPGKYALEFAGRSRHVTGVDLSPKMIAFAKENAAAKGVDNVLFEVADWNTLSLEDKSFNKKFDLVFASMCPGINSRDTLLKMCGASRGSCFISGFVNRRDYIRDELYTVIYGKAPEQSRGKNIYCAFNILWLSGYHPEITYLDTEWENTWPMEKACEIFKHQLRLRDADNSCRSGQIEEFLDKIAPDGMVTEKVRAKIAWMWWKI